VGIWWDAIRVPYATGIRALGALKRLPGHPTGPVIADLQRSEPLMYFLVPTNTAAHWNVGHTHALGQTYYLVVPDASCTEPPGLHWAVAPGADRRLTDPHSLREVLEAAAVR
jgi:hypothetical protein